MATDEVTYPGSVFRMQHNYVHDANGGNAVKSRAQRNEIYFNWIEGALYHELELIGPDPGRRQRDTRRARGLRRGRQRAAQDQHVLGRALRRRRDRRQRGPLPVRVQHRAHPARRRRGVPAVRRARERRDARQRLPRRGGATVNLLREVEAAWVAGRVVGGDRNWVTSGSQNVPPEWTGTISGTDPGFANAALLDLRPRPAPRSATPVPPAPRARPATRSRRRSSRRR